MNSSRPSGLRTRRISASDLAWSSTVHRTSVDTRDVERGVVKGQLLGRRPHDLDRAAVLADATLEPPGHRILRLDRGQLGNASAVVAQVRARAGADLEHPA
jgi:hypothetical protein